MVEWIDKNILKIGGWLNGQKNNYEKIDGWQDGQEKNRRMAGWIEKKDSWMDSSNIPIHHT